jgi:hypothetical protein
LKNITVVVTGEYVFGFSVPPTESSGFSTGVPPFYAPGDATYGPDKFGTGIV